MKAKYKFMALIAAFLFTAVATKAQTEEQHISKVELGKKKKMYFNNRDSSSVVYIDTLILKDGASLQFMGKKDVKLVVKHAEIGKKAFISGTAGRNNASNFDISMDIKKLGSLYIVASGRDAINGAKTDPNGDGGKVKFSYAATGINPQTTDKKGKNYLFVDVSAGGRMINPTADLGSIYSRINMAPAGLRGLPQGQIYSGSPGIEGKVEISAE